MKKDRFRRLAAMALAAATVRGLILTVSHQEQIGALYPQVLENVRVTDKKAAQNDPAVQEAVKAVAEALGDTGRILVRESGTEPLVRVMVEAPDHDTCQKYVDEVVNVICEKGYKA